LVVVSGHFDLFGTLLGSIFNLLFRKQLFDPGWPLTLGQLGHWQQTQRAIERERERERTSI